MSFASRKLALSVDRVIDDRDFVIKSPGPQLARIRMITGASLSPEGKATPVLNLTDLLIKEKTTLPVAPYRYEIQQTTAAGKIILVVEDSVTSRVLLKGVLESAGYDVKTAVDGAEAFALLKSEPVDIVVSDIDMPRMDGLELTRKIRTDKSLSDLPVVLVSALESREDQEAGIEAGANAYIVKSRFDNVNLISTVKRLV